MESGVDIRDALFDEIYNIAANDTDVIFITADADAFSLRRYREDFPDRFINVGVAEQNMVNVAAGLTLSGKKVFIYAISSFLTMRAYEQIKFNICSMNLPVTLIGLGSGFSFNFDGPSHHGVIDIGLMRLLPEMEIYNPSTPLMTSEYARIAYEKKSPTYIRLDKGVLPELYNARKDFLDGLNFLREGEQACIIATGTMVHFALSIASELSNRNIDLCVIDLHRVKPLNNKGISEIIQNYKNIYLIEEHSIIGGIGEIIKGFVANLDYNNKVKIFSLPDEQCFIYGKRDFLLEQNEISSEKILESIISDF